MIHIYSRCTALLALTAPPAAINAAYKLYVIEFIKTFRDINILYHIVCRMTISEVVLHTNQKLVNADELKGILLRIITSIV